MKKKLLAVLMTGMMIGALSACGSTTEVTEEPPMPAALEVEPEQDEPEEPAQEEEPEIVSPDHVVDIPESVWMRLKTHDSWVVTEGLFWHLVDINGDTVVEGTLYAEDEDTFSVYDNNGDLYATFSITEDGDLFDETYQELYYNVCTLPQEFPAQLAEEYGFEPITGEWNYQEQNEDDPATYDDVAFVQVCQDGTYTIRYYDDDSTRDGIILVELDEFPDGSTSPIYSFFEGGNNFWNGCYVGNYEGDTIYMGNGGSARLVATEGQG